MSSPFLGYPVFSWSAAPFGLLYSFEANSGIPKSTYSDKDNLIPNINPVQLDATGSAIVRLGSGSYKFVLLDQSNTVTLFTADYYDAPLGLSDITVSLIGGLLYPQTAAEGNAGVTPTYLYYPPLDPRRYGAIGNNLTNDAAAVQAAFTVAGKAGGAVIFPAGFTFLCNTDITVPVAASAGAPVASAQGPGWSTISVVFGTGATFGFIILGTGATTADVQGSTYNYAGSFSDLGIQIGAGMSGFYVNSVNQPRVKNCWIEGAGTTSNRGAYFLNCLVPVFEDCLVTGCGSATQYSVEFDTCTTPLWRGSRISGGNTTKGGLAIDRCTNFVGEGMAVESCGTPIVIGGKAEAALACTGVILRGLELENPGHLGQYISIGAGLTGTALVLDVLIDGMFGSPSGTDTVAYGIKMSNLTGFEARSCHFTLGSAPTSCFEIANTAVTGVIIQAHRNLQSLGVAWVRYNGTQVKHAGPQMRWQLGVTSAGVPVCTSPGLDGMQAQAVTGASITPVISASMGGYWRSMSVSQGGAQNITMAILEAGAEVYLYAADGNSTATFGATSGLFITRSGANLNLVSGNIYGFKSNGTAWSQMG